MIYGLQFLVLHFRTRYKGGEYLYRSGLRIYFVTPPPSFPDGGFFILYMPTLHQRLVWNESKLTAISKEQKVELGRLIADYYVNHKQDFPFPLKRTSSKEPSGTFNVLFYPKEFTKKMDEIIIEYHSKLSPVKKPRTRKPLPVKIPT